MPDAGHLLDVARGELGTYENPRGSNLTPYGAWYGMNPAAWCAMWVSYVADRSGCGDVIPRHAYTPDGVAWFKERGQWVTGGYQPGDVVYYQWATSDRVCHVGLVEAFDGDTITAIEGNTHAPGESSTQDRVMRQYRTAYVVGAGRPAFDDMGGATTVASYFCEVAQNTGQEVSPAGELIRWQEERDDDAGWHRESYPGIFPTVRIGGNVTATIYVDGPALVELRTYTSGDDRLSTFARATAYGPGYVNLAGYCKVSEGQYVAMAVDPAGADPVTCRSGVLSIGARQL